MYTLFNYYQSVKLSGRSLFNMVHCVLFDFFYCCMFRNTLNIIATQTIVINTRDVKYVIEM